MAEGGRDDDDDDYGWIVDSVEKLGFTDNGSVREWLMEIRQSVEMECQYVFQTKSIKTACRRNTSESPRFTNKNKILMIHELWSNISSDIISLQKKDQTDLEVFIEACKKTSSQLFDLKIYFRECIEVPHTDFKEMVGDLDIQAVQFSLLLNSNRQRSEDLSGHRLKLLLKLGRLKASFAEIVSYVLRKLVEDFLKENFSSFESAAFLGNNSGITKRPVLTESLAEFNCLCLASDDICDIVASVKGIDLLLKTYSNCDADSLRGEVLRSLATCCSTPSSSIAFFKACGFESLTSILSSPSSNHSLKFEAAGLLAQVTNVTSSIPRLNITMDSLLPQLIESLIDLCKQCKDQDEFLLITSTLTNLLKLDPRTSKLMHMFNLVRVLLELPLTSRLDTSLLIKDQILTLLHTILTIHDISPDLYSEFCYLMVTYIQEKPENTSSSSELPILERVQKKSATLIATTCEKIPKLVDHFADVECTPILLEVCKEPSLRNDSDPVLKACLAALSSLHSHHLHHSKSRDLTTKKGTYSCDDVSQLSYSGSSGGTSSCYTSSKSSDATSTSSSSGQKSLKLLKGEKQKMSVIRYDLDGPDLKETLL